MTYAQPVARPAAPRTWDLVLGIVLYALAGLLGAASVAGTGLFAMAADSCSSDHPCHEQYLTIGMLVSWGGTFLALAGGLAMIVLAAVRHRLIWIWGGLPVLLVPAAFFAGLFIAAHIAG